MNASENNLRKAAVLLASLDQETADTLIEQMAPEQAMLVRQALIALEHLDPTEQEAVIDEFFRIGPMSRPHDGVELDASLARRLAMEVEEPELSSTSQIVEKTLESHEPPSFEFLRTAEPNTLADLLHEEHPQTIALVMTHVAPEVAGHVLGSLPATLQADVIRRIADLRMANPQIVQEIARGLQSRMSWVAPGAQPVGGIGVVADILRTSGRKVERSILENLQGFHPDLAWKLRRPGLSFEQLEQFGPTVMARVVRAAPPEVALLALADIAPDLVSAVLAKLPSGEARWLRHGLDHLPPTRLSDVEEAKQHLVQLAEELDIGETMDQHRTTRTAESTPPPASPWQDLSLERSR